MKPGTNNPKRKVGFFDGGMVFKISANIKGKKIRITVIKEKDGKKYCNYAGAV